jgi:hypothetical protein
MLFFVTSSGAVVPDALHTQRLCDCGVIHLEYHSIFLRMAVALREEECYAGRQTFVIDKSGNCALSFNDMLNSTQHTDEALACTLRL